MFSLRSLRAANRVRDNGMNQILFMIGGGWPVHAGEALLGFGALVLVLLLSIVVVVARSGRRGTDLALQQALRADELEQRLAELTRAQSEAHASPNQWSRALAGGQSEMAPAVNKRLGSVTHRV